jgi:hypothetical protein
MKTYKSYETYNVTGRELIKAVCIPSTDRLPCQDEIVEIDGDQYKVRGCEYSMMLMYPPVRGESVGLLVTKL